MKRSSAIGLLFLFCAVCASLRLTPGGYSLKLPFFHPLEVGRAPAGAEGAEAAEDDAEEEDSPGHGSSVVAGWKALGAGWFRVNCDFPG